MVDSLTIVCQFGEEIDYMEALTLAQVEVLSTAKEFPPAHEPASFTVEQLPAKVRAELSAGVVSYGEHGPFFGSEEQPFGTLSAGFPPAGPYAEPPSYVVDGDTMAQRFGRYLVTEGVEREITRVQSIKYNNPLEIVALVSVAGLVVLGAIQTIRDIPGRLRVNRAQAQDLENIVRDRDRLRQHVIGLILSGDIQLSPTDMYSLFTADVDPRLLFWATANWKSKTWAVSAVRVVLHPRSSTGINRTPQR